MILENMKTCLTFLMTKKKKIQIKTTLRHPFSPIRLAKHPNTTHRLSEATGKLTLSHTTARS